MSKHYLLLIYLLSAAFIRPVHGQAISRYNIFSYGVNEGLLQTTLSDIEIDKNNFCWISFPNGIQKFDGKSFTTIPVQPGLPDDNYTKFFRCTNGDLLICHPLGISRYNITADNFSLVYQQPASGQKSPPVIIGEDAGILYCFDQSTGIVTALECNSFKILSTFETGLTSPVSDVNTRLRFSDNIINGKSALQSGSTVYLLDLREKKIISKAHVEGLLYSYLLQLKSEYEVLYYNGKMNDELQCLNFITNTSHALPVMGKDKDKIARCVIFPGKNKRLISFNNRLFETDSTLQVLNAELVNFQNQAAAGTAGIHRIKEDNFGNLYLQTVTGGIRKIIRNTYPVKYFGTTDPQVNNILAILPDKKNNRVLAGGTGGLFVFDTLQHLIKHFKNAPGNGKDFSPNGIIKSGTGGYIIFCIGSKKAWLLNGDLSNLSAIPLISVLPPQKSYVEFFGNPLLNTGTEAIFQTQQKLYRINFKSKKITEHQFSTAYIMSGLWYNNMIISHGGNELIFLHGETFKEFKKISFIEPNGVRCLAANSKGEVYAGGNKGIFKIDTAGKILQQWNKSTGLPDECIYAIAFDKEGFLWCSTNKGILKIDKDNHVLQITKQDGLQENEFNTNVLAVAEDGEMYFGGTNGVSSFYPSSISSFDDRTNVLFTGIRANNFVVDTTTATWNIRTIKLPYRQNALSFDFIAMGNNNPDQYVYQYKMEKVDNEWVQNNNMQTVRYSLSPGKYVFKVYASRSFNKDAEPMKEIHITIRPPFWQLWWFRAGLALFVLSLLYYFINQRNKRKYAERLQQLEHERQLKLERERISKDLHDSLGAYANAVLYNTELLANEKSDSRREELIDDLKFSSKDIITALRETVWALKKEEYTAEECMMRIRNFIHPFAKYYSHIQFTVQGEAPDNVKFNYTKALHFVRIVQEAVSNSIKHASPSLINIVTDHEQDRWILKITDNGKGFNCASRKEAERGNGLTNMEHRAAEAGFELKIESKDREGTTITVIT